MRKKIYLVIAVLVFGMAASVQKDNWLRKLEKIKPLASIEKDVERVLGKSKDRYADVGEYETKEGLFTVTYSEGRCKSSITPKYNIEKGIVVKLDFRPRKKLTISSSNVDLSNFAKSEDSDASGDEEYSNTEKGIIYYFYKNSLNYVEVFPRDDLSYLECTQQSEIQ